MIIVRAIWAVLLEKGEFSVVLLALEDHFLEFWTVCSYVLGGLFDQFYLLKDTYSWFIQAEWWCRSFFFWKLRLKFCLCIFKALINQLRLLVKDDWLWILVKINHSNHLFYFLKSFFSLSHLFAFSCQVNALRFKAISFHRCHFLSNNLWLAACQISILSSTLAFKHSLMNCLLSFDTLFFWFAGKFTCVAFSIIPSFSTLSWLILSPNGFSPNNIS